MVTDMPEEIAINIYGKNGLERMPTIDAIRAYRGRALGFMPVMVEGELSAGDGGGGFYRWDRNDRSSEVSSDTDNTWVAPFGENGTNGAWQRIGPSTSGGGGTSWVRETLTWDSASETLSVNDRQAYKQISLEADVTSLSIDSVPSGYVQVFFEFIIGAGAPHNITAPFWTDTIKWVNAKPGWFAELSQGDRAYVEIWTDDDGGTWVGSASVVQQVKSISGTSHTIAVADQDTLHEFTDDGGTVTVTLPSGLDLLPGATFPFEQNGTSGLSFADDGTSSINSRGGLTSTAGQYAVAVATYKGNDVWLLSGDLA